MLTNSEPLTQNMKGEIIMKKLFMFMSMPLFDGETTAAAAPVETVAAVETAASTTETTATTPTYAESIIDLTDAEKLAEAKKLLSNLKDLGVEEVGDLINDADKVIDDAVAKLEAEAKETVAEIVAFQQTLFQKHPLIVNAINDVLACAGVILVFKFLGILQ